MHIGLIGGIGWAEEHRRRRILLLLRRKLRGTALRPTHLRRHLYVTCYTEGFNHFATSMSAPVASGGSVRRVGLAPTGKRRLVTAHT